MEVEFSGQRVTVEGQNTAAGEKPSTCPDDRHRAIASARFMMSRETDLAECRKAELKRHARWDELPASVHFDEWPLAMFSLIMPTN